MTFCKYLIFYLNFTGAGAAGAGTFIGATKAGAGATKAKELGLQKSWKKEKPMAATSPPQAHREKERGKREQNKKENSYYVLNYVFNYVLNYLLNYVLHFPLYYVLHFPFNYVLFFSPFLLFFFLSFFSFPPLSLPYQFPLLSLSLSLSRSLTPLSLITYLTT